MAKFFSSLPRLLQTSDIFGSFFRIFPRCLCHFRLRDTSSGIPIPSSFYDEANGIFFGVRMTPLAHFCDGLRTVLKPSHGSATFFYFFWRFFFCQWTPRAMLRWFQENVYTFHWLSYWRPFLPGRQMVFHANGYRSQARHRTALFRPHDKGRRRKRRSGLPCCQPSSRFLLAVGQRLSAGTNRSGPRSL